MSVVSIGKVAFTVEGDWDITKRYEKLTIVSYDDGEGAFATYCSKIDVPPGVLITDTTYWHLLLRGIFAQKFGSNKRIGMSQDAITREFKIVDNIIDEFKNDVNNKFTEITTSISELNDKVDVVKETLTTKIEIVERTLSSEISNVRDVLNAKIDDTRNLLLIRISETESNLLSKINDLENELNSKFNTLNQKIDDVNSRLTTEITRTNNNLNEFKQEVSVDLSKIYARLDSIDTVLADITVFKS